MKRRADAFDDYVRATSFNEKPLKTLGQNDSSQLLFEPADTFYFERIRSLIGLPACHGVFGYGSTLNVQQSAMLCEESISLPYGHS